jgi:hypothetical protein
MAIGWEEVEAEGGEGTAIADSSATGAEGANA